MERPLRFGAGDVLFFARQGDKLITKIRVSDLLRRKKTLMKKICVDQADDSAAPTSIPFCKITGSMQRSKTTTQQISVMGRQDVHHVWL